MYRFTQGEPSEQQIAVLLVALTLMATFAFLFLTAIISGWLGHKAACARESLPDAAPISVVPPAVVTIKKCSGCKTGTCERAAVTESVV